MLEYVLFDKPSVSLPDSEHQRASASGHARSKFPALSGYHHWLFKRYRGIPGHLPAPMEARV